MGGEPADHSSKIPEPNPIGVDEARSYLDAFASLQLWVLSLPDEVSGGHPGWQIVDDPIKRAQALIKGETKPTLEQVVKELAKGHKSALRKKDNFNVYNLPPSAKPELLAVTFALLVHTYCELLEVGMESTAHCLRDAFKPVYDPLYPAEYRDLYQCTTTEDTMRLNSHNSQHMEALNALKSILVQVAQYQLHREELNAQAAVMDSGGSSNAQQQQAREHKIKEYDRHIQILKQKYNESSQKACAAFDKMHDLPFLRRARAVRWQLTMSTTTYGMLSSFLNQRDDSLLAMSTLLQTKCELHIERRDPLPFTPACVLDETSKGQSSLDLNRLEIQWAAPSIRHEDANIKLGDSRKLPFPKLKLDEEYENERQASLDKQKIKFNRALLVNGFRRLEALERKREYEVLPSNIRKRIKSGEDVGTILSRTISNALEPSILLTTLTTDLSTISTKKHTSSISSSRSATSDVAAIWDEPGIGLCCAKMCEPDGRRVAAGCDDSSIRIYDITGSRGTNEPSMVLLGHKNGFPVFDVDWNRDGRCLLSCGGDGSIRLWDTMAVGPFGEVANISLSASKPGQDTTFSLSMSKKKTHDTLPNSLKGDVDSGPNMNIPGLRRESAPYSSGAALAVYRGHVPCTPVWSVSFCPAGYYFATTGADSTARLWTTDRPAPVRLFTGHTSNNVNCVAWHPNCNYILTGGDDKTCRLWDVMTGRTVRLLSGCHAGINTVTISPGGRYAVGSDYSGIIHMWDLGNGKKVTEFRSMQKDSNASSLKSLVHSMSFSACGSALATGGDDCCVRIWDTRTEALDRMPVVEKPFKSFSTKKTLVMDVSYTRRNMLLCLGKLVNSTPAVSKASSM